MVGRVLTVIAEVVLLQPPDVAVKVNVGDPAEIPVTKPPFVTVAMASLLLAQVPPEVGDSVVVPLIQMEVEPVMLTVGITLTEVAVDDVAVPAAHPPLV
jgi:hypothetical protein